MKILIAGVLLAFSLMEAMAVPNNKWVMKQVWSNLSFTHFQVDPEEIRKLIPAQLELDTYNGEAYVGVVTLEMTDGYLNNLGIPLYHPFPQVNVRTYVRCNGKRGIYFFNIDADNTLGAIMANVVFDLPYFKADINWEKNKDLYYVNSSSRGREFEISFRPVKYIYSHSNSPFEVWLTEIYRSYQVSRNGRVSESNLWHKPFVIQKLDARLLRDEAFNTLNLRPVNSHPSFHYVDRTETYFWKNKKVECK